jgi:hypothetical protein
MSLVRTSKCLANGSDLAAAGLAIKAISPGHFSAKRTSTALRG